MFVNKLIYIKSIINTGIKLNRIFYKTIINNKKSFNKNFIKFIKSMILIFTAS